MAAKVKVKKKIYTWYNGEEKEKVEYSDAYYDSSYASEYIRKDALKCVEGFQSLAGFISTDKETFVSWLYDHGGDIGGRIQYEIIEARD